jgi:hypothetical protein
MDHEAVKSFIAAANSNSKSSPPPSDATFKYKLALPTGKYFKSKIFSGKYEHDSRLPP